MSAMRTHAECIAKAVELEETAKNSVKGRADYLKMARDVFPIRSHRRGDPSIRPHVLEPCAGPNLMSRRWSMMAAGV
jgi:hypothetical protein